MVFVHSGLIGTQLHNPKGIQYAEDVFNFNTHSWKNSGLIWNETIGRWKAKPSGGGSGYSTEGELTSLLNDNYPGSSNINRTLLNTISSNLDTRVDSLFGFSSNSRRLYHPSGNGKFPYISTQALSGGSLHTGILYGNTISGIAWPVYAGSVVNKNYVDTISGGIVAKVGAGTLSGPLASNIGSDFTYGISGLAFVSSNLAAFSSMTIRVGSNKLANLKFREGTGELGFTIQYSGATPGDSFHILRDSQGDGIRRVISIGRENGQVDIGENRVIIFKPSPGTPYVAISGNIKTKYSISSNKSTSDLVKIVPSKRPGSTPVLGEIWLSGTSTVCAGFYGCTGSRWLKFSMV